MSNGGKKIRVFFFVLSVGSQARGSSCSCCGSAIPVVTLLQTAVPCLLVLDVLGRENLHLCFLDRFPFSHVELRFVNEQRARDAVTVISALGTVVFGGRALRPAVFWHASRSTCANACVAVSLASNSWSKNRRRMGRSGLVCSRTAVFLQQGL